MARTKKRKNRTAGARDNPLLQKQQAFLETLSATEREAFFDQHAVTPDRRAQVWGEQADLGERLVNEYAWAIPNDRALRVIQHFSPIVEMGCGANAYWCRQLQAKGVDIVGYDVAPDKGGKIEEETSANDKNKPQTEFQVLQGSPHHLSKHSDRTLLLCYPDELTSIDEKTAKPYSMALECLEHYHGDYIIHVGELFVTGCLSLDQAPWGRSSSAEFQEQLAAQFHCVLSIELPNWLHTVDRLTVWKRSPTTTIVFAGESDDSESDEEVDYRHIPVAERLPANVAAPCLQHLLTDDNTVPQHSFNNQKKEEPRKKKKKRKKDDGSKQVAAKESTEQSKTAEYACPW